MTSANLSLLTANRAIEHGEDELADPDGLDDVQVPGAFDRFYRAEYRQVVAVIYGLTTTTVPTPSAEDASLVAAFVEFAIAVEVDDLRSPIAWEIDVELFRAYVGPFSALMLLEQADDYAVRVGPHPHCASPPQPSPVGLEDHTRTSIQPSDDSLDSCLDWWTVDFFVGPSGSVDAITMDLWEP
jgi:hypothetical protein